MMIAIRLHPRLCPPVRTCILTAPLAMLLLLLQTKLPAHFFHHTINKTLSSPKMILFPLPLLTNASLRPRNYHRHHHRQRQYPSKPSTSKFIWSLIASSFLIFDNAFSNLLLLLLFSVVYFSDCLGDSSSDLSNSSYYHRIVIR